jgi:hypothetical protein
VAVWQTCGGARSWSVPESLAALVLVAAATGVGAAGLAVLGGWYALRGSGPVAGEVGGP